MKAVRSYLTLINGRPLIAFRKTVVMFVRSLQAAVVEANYVNREQADIRWVLRGHTLAQEPLFTTGGVPCLLVRPGEGWLLRQATRRLGFQRRLR